MDPVYHPWPWPYVEVDTPAPKVTPRKRDPLDNERLENLTVLLDQAQAAYGGHLRAGLREQDAGTFDPECASVREEMIKEVAAEMKRLVYAIHEIKTSV